MGGSAGSSTTVMSSLPSFLTDGTPEGGKVRAYLDKAQLISSDSSYAWLFESYDGATYVQGKMYAPFQTVDGFVPEQEGIDALATRGRNGNVTIDKGITYVKNAIDGAYLDGSRSEFQTMLSNATGNPENSFATISADLGASLYLIGDLSAENMAQTLTVNTPARYLNRTSAEMYKSNWQQERIHQGGAISIGPEFANQSIEDADNLRKAGLYYRIWEQGSLKERYDYYYEVQVAQIRRIEVLGDAIRTLVGSRIYEKSTKPYYKASPLSAMAGGAMAGAATGSPWGVAGGAVLGLLASQ